MKKLINLLKVIEIEIRSNNKMSQSTWEKLSDLNEWDHQITKAFMVDVNLAIQRQDMNFVYKTYNIDTPYKNIIKYDILIACLKRNQHDLILTDVINRLVIPENTSYKYLEVWGMEVDKARNYSVQKAFEYGCEYILFIDDDMIVENTALLKIWETMKETGKLVVGAEYQRKADYEITAHGNFFDTDKDHLKETDLCAMGFTLINIYEISKKVPAPYFWIFHAPDGLWSMGEDAFFTKNIISYLNERPLIDFRPSVIHYDKVWKRHFGKRNKDVTYATNTIEDFVTFDHIRVPPKHPLINICVPKREENDPIATNLDTLLCLRGYKTELSQIWGYEVDEARNQLATNSVKMGSEFTLFIDNDIILPETSLIKMLEVMEQDEDHEYGAVSGDYLLKGRIPHSSFLQLDETGKVTELNRIKNDKSFDCNWLIGMGCCLVRTEVFRQIQYPYFKCISPKLNKVGVDLTEDGGVNEDAYFSEMLFINGYKINILNDIKCIHVDFQNAKMYGYDKDLNKEKYSCFPWVDNIEYINIDNILE